MRSKICFSTSPPKLVANQLEPHGKAPEIINCSSWKQIVHSCYVFLTGLRSYILYSLRSIHTFAITLVEEYLRIASPNLLTNASAPPLLPASLRCTHQMHSPHQIGIGTSLQDNCLCTGFYQQKLELEISI